MSTKKQRRAASRRTEAPVGDGDIVCVGDWVVAILAIPITSAYCGQVIGFDPFASGLSASKQACPVVVRVVVKLREQGTMDFIDVFDASECVKITAADAVKLKMQYG